MANEGLNIRSYWSSREKSSAKDLPGRFAFEIPQKLRQSVMEITYGSGDGACRPKVRSGFGITTCRSK
jgi:hypothetical protein